MRKTRKMNTEQYKKLAIKLLNESSASGNKEIIVPVGQKQLFSYAPSLLYKYCRINEYTFLNIVNDQFYIAPLDVLDDQFEARLSFRSDFASYYQEVMTSLKKIFPDKLKKSEIITEEQLSDLYQGKNVEELDKGKNVSDLIELIDKASEKDDLDEVLAKLFVSIIRIRDEYGVCSLSENKDSQIMWQMYADNYQGICIEYDFEYSDDDYLKTRLFPVTYIDSRQNDPLAMLMEVILINIFRKDVKAIGDFINEWIIDLLTTKNKEWQLQKEWRIIGKAKELFSSPKIKAIYLGNRISDDDKEKLIKIAAEKQIQLYEVSEDYEKLKIAFKKIEE